MRPESEQSFDSKQGEVIYRRKLALQQSSEGQAILPEAHTKQEILAVMQERMAQTRRDVETIIAEGVPVSPYLELGAERCQRALVLENEFNAAGFALDISLDMLRYASIIAERFGLAQMPIRIACDAYNLPFRNETIAFAFCYQTLHHFPSPRPICEEISRVLHANGGLFFDDEPVRGYYRRLMPTYHRRGHDLSAFERLVDKLGLLSVLSKADVLEQEHGILEEEFDIPMWRRTLSGFQPIHIVVNRKLRIRVNSLNWSPGAVLAQLAGGNIQVLAKKAGGHNAEEYSDTKERLLDLLGCPNCADKPALSRSSGHELRCPQCKTSYPEIDGVWLLFEKSLGRRLYPEYFSA